MQRFILEKVEIIKSSSTNIILVDDFSKKYLLWHNSNFGTTYKNNLAVKEVTAMVENSNLSKYIKTDEETFKKYFDCVYVKECVETTE